MRSLTAPGKIATMAQSAVRLNFNQAADVHLHLFAQIAFHTAFGFNRGAKTRDFVLRQILNLLRVVYLRFFGERLRALLPDSVNGRKADPEPLVRRKIHTCDASHAVPPCLFNPGAGGALRSNKSRAPLRADEPLCTSCKFSLPMLVPSSRLRPSLLYL